MTSDPTTPRRMTADELHRLRTRNYDGPYRVAVGALFDHIAAIEADLAAERERRERAERLDESLSVAKEIARQARARAEAAERERDEARAHLSDLLPERDAYSLMLTQTGRDRDALRGQVAALREACVRVTPHTGERHCLLCRASTYTAGAEPFHTCVLADTEKAAAEHDERVRAEAIEAERASWVAHVNKLRAFFERLGNDEPSSVMIGASGGLDRLLRERTGEPPHPEAEAFEARIRAEAIEAAAKACEAEADAERRFGKQKAAISAFTVAATRIRALAPSPPRAEPVRGTDCDCTGHETCDVCDPPRVVEDAPRSETSVEADRELLRAVVLATWDAPDATSPEPIIDAALAARRRS